MADTNTELTIREDGAPVVITARLNALNIPLGTARTIDGLKDLLIAVGIGPTDKYSAQCCRGLGANGEWPDGGTFKLKMDEPFPPSFFAIIRCFLRGDSTGISAGFLTVSSDGDGVIRVPEDLPPAVFDDGDAPHVVWDGTVTNQKAFGREVYIVEKGKDAAEFEPVENVAGIWELAKAAGIKAGAKIDIDVTRELTDAEKARKANDLDHPGIGGADHFYRVEFVLRYELLEYLWAEGPPVYITFNRKGARGGSRGGSPPSDDLLRMLAGALGRR